MRALFFVVVSALGLLVGKNAAAQDTPAAPPETASPEPSPDPAPPPAAPPPAAPPAEPSPPPPSAPPPAASAPTPPPPPTTPPEASPPTKVTLEETPEEPLSVRPGGAGKAPAGPTSKPHRKPKPASFPVEPPPEQTSAPADSATPAEKPLESDDPEYRSKKSEGDGLLGPFRIGGLVGVGLPSLLGFGGMIKLTRFFGAGVNVGLIPAIKLALYGDAQLSYQEYDLYGRLFPFGGDLFLGAGVGYASIKGTFSSSYNVSA
ncbi:MAG TPA: hypothetical protein VF395_08060, partial [Polyangiaceae bacterium]